MDKKYRKQIESQKSNLEGNSRREGSTFVVERTFGHLMDETPISNEHDTKLDIPEKVERLEEQNTKFTREMKMLGHESVTSPKSIKSKSASLIKCRV